MSSSSSDEAPRTKQPKGTKKDSKSADNQDQDYQIKPSKGGPSCDTSKWPLLLKVMTTSKPPPNFLFSSELRQAEC